MTHPFHPLCGRQLPVAFRVQSWAEDRVYYRDAQGELTSVPAAWTDLGPVDPYVVLSAGRSPFRVADLLALAVHLQRLARDQQSGEEV